MRFGFGGGLFGGPWSLLSTVARSNAGALRDERGGFMVTGGVASDGSELPPILVDVDLGTAGIVDGPLATRNVVMMALAFAPGRESTSAMPTAAPSGAHVDCLRY